jgi:SAM-dependent methyltransferase
MGIPLSIDPNKQSYELYDELDYKDFWSGWQQRKLNQAEHIIVKKMLPQSGRRLLDLGCGFGRLTDSYFEQFSKVFMFDGSIPFLQEARQKTNDKAVYIAGDVQRLPFRGGSFDAVLMVRVLHHVLDEKKCLVELFRILSSGGNLVFTYRNKLYLINIFRWLFHPKSEMPFSLSRSGIGTTLLSHHPKYIRQLLIQTGFASFKYQGVGMVDRLANVMKPYGRYAPTGKLLAPILGNLKIAPWMFCSAVARGETKFVDSDRVEDLLTCLECGGNIEKTNDGYECVSCKHLYPLTDGIIDFRVPDKSM